MKFRKEKKELTDAQIDVLNAVHNLLYRSEIPFSKLDSIVEEYSTDIESLISEHKECERRDHINILKSNVERNNKYVEATKQKIDKCNNYLTELRASLEELKNKKVYERDENAIRNTLWWIFNNEEELNNLKDELKKEEACLRESEDLLKAEEEK